MKLVGEIVFFLLQPFHTDISNCTRFNGPSLLIEEEYKQSRTTRKNSIGRAQWFPLDLSRCCYYCYIVIVKLSVFVRFIFYIILFCSCDRYRRQIVHIQLIKVNRKSLNLCLPYFVFWIMLSRSLINLILFKWETYSINRKMQVVRFVIDIFKINSIVFLVTFDIYCEPTKWVMKSCINMFFTILREVKHDTFDYILFRETIIITLLNWLFSN